MTSDRTLTALRRRTNRARAGTPKHCVTCPASRHLHLMADALTHPRKGDEPRYPMLQEEPEHCAESIYAVLAALWEARTELATLRAVSAPAKPADESTRGAGSQKGRG